MVLPLGYAILVATLQWTGTLSLKAVVVSHVAANAAVFGIGYLALRRTFESRTPGSEAAATGPHNDPGVMELLRYGLRAQVGQASQGLILKTDQAVIAVSLPARQVGVYVVAAGAANVLTLVSSALRQLAVPRIARTAVGSSDRHAEGQRLIKIFWRTALPLGLAVCMMLPLAVPLVYGRAYIDAVPLAIVLTIATIGYGLKDVLVGVSLAEGSPWTGSKGEVVGLIIGLTLLAILLPPFGLIGASFASLVGYWAGALYLWRLRFKCGGNSDRSRRYCNRRVPGGAEKSS